MPQEARRARSKTSRQPASEFLLEQHPLQRVVGQAVAPDAVGQGVLGVGDPGPVQPGVADQPAEGGHQRRRPLVRAHPQDHPEGLHVRGLVLVLAQQDVARGGRPPADGEGGAALDPGAPGGPGPAQGDSGHLGADVHQQGGGEGHAGAFGDAPNLLHQMGGEGLDRRQEGQRPVGERPGVRRGRAPVRARPGAQADRAQPGLGAQHAAQGLGVAPDLLAAGLAELTPALPRGAAHLDEGEDGAGGGGHAASRWGRRGPLPGPRRRRGWRRPCARRSPAAPDSPGSAPGPRRSGGRRRARPRCTA